MFSWDWAFPAAADRAWNDDDDDVLFYVASIT